MTLEEALKTLTPREEKIIRMRYGIGYHKVYTFREIAKEFNLSNSRIQQITNQALQKLQDTNYALEIIKDARIILTLMGVRHDVVNLCVGR